MLKLAANRQQEVLNRAWVNSINSLQKKRWDNLTEMTDIFKNIGQDVKKQFNKIITAVQAGEMDEATQMTRLGLLTQDIRRMARSLGVDITENLNRDLVDVYKNSYYRAAWQLDIATPDNIAANFAMLPDSQVQAAIVSQFKGGMFSERLFIIGDEAAIQIQRDVTIGILTGRPIEETADEIYNKFGDEGAGYFYRAQLIARTETIRARELGRIQLYKENADIIEKIIWVCMESAFDLGPGKGECEICAPLDGQETDLEPIIDTHPNCVCTKRAVLKDWDELTGDEGDESDGPVYKPFDEWAADKGIDLTPAGEEE